MNYEFVAFGYPLGESMPSFGGTLAFSVNLIQPGNLSKTDDTGTVVNGNGTFSGGDQVCTLAYARAIGSSVHAGFSVKLIQQQIDTFQTSLFDMDAGIVVLPPMDGMRIGFTLKNLGAQSSGFDLPFSLNAGISYRRYENFREHGEVAPIP